MKIKILRTYQDCEGGTYNKIDVRITNNDGAIKNVSFKSSRELINCLNSNNNIKMENFTVANNQISFKRDVVVNKIINDKQNSNLDIKLNTIDNKIGKVLNSQFEQLREIRQLPSVTDNTSSLETKIDIINSKLDSILMQLINEQDYIDDMKNELISKLESTNTSLSTYIDKIMDKLNPTYINTMKSIDMQEFDRNKYLFPKCESDLHSWRYGGIDTEKMNFNYILDDNNNYVVAPNSRFDTNEILGELNKINNSESNINVRIDINKIVIMRNLLKLYDKCRKAAESSYMTDAKSKVNEKYDSELTSTLTVCGIAVGDYIKYILRAAEVAVFDSSAAIATTSVAAIVTGSAVATGVGPLLFGLSLALEKIIKHEITVISSDAGSRRVNLKLRGIKASHSDLEGSLIIEDTDILKTKDVTHRELDILSNDLKSTNQDIRDNAFKELENLVTFNCRVFTIDKLKAMTKKSFFERKHKGNTHCTGGSPEYTKITKYSMCRKRVTDERLFSFYAKYIVKPILGIRTSDDKSKAKVLSKSSSDAKTELFNCVQNAYFASFIYLLLDEDLMTDISDERVEWLFTCEEITIPDTPAVGDIYKNVKAFIENMKISLCLQGLSPLCADKLLDRFCQFGNIQMRILSDTYTDDVTFRVDI